MNLPLSKSTIRSLRPEDAASIARHIGEYEVSRYLLLVPHPYKLQDAESWLARVFTEKPETDFGIAVQGEIVGVIGLKIDQATVPGVAPHLAEIGYWLAKPYWGRGIASEALAALTEWAFAELRLTRLQAGVFAPNAASARVLEKAGYEYEGRLRARYFREGRHYDGLLYAKVRLPG